MWLCHNVIGPLLAPPYFPFGMPTGKSGKASKEDIDSALRAFVNHLKQKGIRSPFSVTADEAIEVLRYLELCIPVENVPGVYQIPALLQDSIPDDAWVEDSKLDVYRGQRYECDRSVDIISPSSFVILQSRCSRIADTSHQMWKDGIKLVKIVRSKVIECVVKLGLKLGHHLHRHYSPLVEQIFMPGSGKAISRRAENDGRCGVRRKESGSCAELVLFRQFSSPTT